jgi:PX domain
MKLVDKLTVQEFVLRVRKAGQPDIYVGRRYGDFVKLHKRIRTELPGKMLPPLPRKNKKSTTTSFFGGWGDDDASSISSLSTTGGTVSAGIGEQQLSASASRSNLRLNISSRSRSPSAFSTKSTSPPPSDVRGSVTLYREEQRVSLRAFLRTILQNKRVADSKAMEEFLTANPVILNEEELIDIQQRKNADASRIEEQEKFYEIARQRAAELDVYMEKFRQDIVESSMFLATLNVRWLIMQMASRSCFRKSKKKTKSRTSVLSIKSLLNGFELSTSFSLISYIKLKFWVDETGLPPRYITSSSRRTTRQNCSRKPRRYTR